MRILLFTACLLYLAASVIVGRPPACNAEEELRKGLYDDQEWQPIRTTYLDFDGEIGQVEAILLKSRTATGESGTGEPLFAVNLVVVAGSRVIYRFTPNDSHDPFYLDDFLEAKDVTGDTIPELLFHSGNVGASDFGRIEHVLHLPEGESTLWDVAPQRFMTTRRQTFSWMEDGGQPVAVVAEPIVPAGTMDPHFCHGCRHFYQYLSFVWRQDRGAFVLQGAIQSERDFADGTDPLREDLELIRSSLPNKPVQPTRAAEPTGKREAQSCGPRG